MPRLAALLSTRIRPPVRRVSLLVPPLFLTGETAFPPQAAFCCGRTSAESSRGKSRPA